MARRPVFPGVPNVAARLQFPISRVDALPDGSLVMSNFGAAQLFRIDATKLTATLLIDGQRLGANAKRVRGRPPPTAR